tara:strand:+ start:14545 stop:14949 length:405 start_codon:yes stop_codon:yes gene_type:complete
MEIPMPSITLRFGGADTQIKWNRGYNPLKHRITVESLQIAEGMRGGAGEARVSGSLEHLAQLVKTLGAQVVEDAPAPESVPAEVMSLLDLSVKNLRKALTDNDYGAYVEALLAAEKAGKTRKGAVELLEDLING